MMNKDDLKKLADEIKDYLDTLFADPASHITPLRGSELWQVALLEMWLQSHGI